MRLTERRTHRTGLFHFLQVDSHHVGNALQGEQVRLDDPVEVQHVIGPRHGFGQYCVELDRVRQCPQDVVVLDRGQIDRRATALLIPPEERRDVAERDERVPRPQPAEVHHRVANVSELEVKQGDDASAPVVELARIPHDGRLSTPIVNAVAF